MKRILPIFIFIFSFICSEAQVITLNSVFENDSVQIGERVNFNITVETEAGMDIVFPAYTDTLSRNLEILSDVVVDTLFEDGKQILSLDLTVISFSPGWNTVPPQMIRFKNGELHDTIYTRAQLLTVLAPTVNMEDEIKPIKPPVNTPVSFREILPYAGIGLGGAVLIAAIVFLVLYFLRKRMHEETKKEVPLEPAHIIAFRDLDALKEAKLPHNGQVKEYYSRLTDIIRTYLSRLFEINAMESTTSEILEAFNQQEVRSDELNDTLENLLMLADLVKFAKEDPLMKENDMHLENVRKFVEDTWEMFERADVDEGIEESVSAVDDGSQSDEKRLVPRADKRFGIVSSKLDADSVREGALWDKDGKASGEEDLKSSRVEESKTDEETTEIKKEKGGENE